MNRAAKIWLIVGAALIVFGVLLFVAALAMSRWNIHALSTEELVTDTYPVDEPFHSITVLTDTADITFAPSEDGNCRVVCRERKKEKHHVFVRDDALWVEMPQSRDQRVHFSIVTESPSITLYLPETVCAALRIEESTGVVEIPTDFRFGNISISATTGSVRCMASADGELSIRLSTGDMELENVSAGSLKLSTTTGGIRVRDAVCAGRMEVSVKTGFAELTDVSCLALTSGGSTGDLNLKNVVAAERISAERSTGGIWLDGCDAGELYLKTTTGSVSGSLLTEKVFLIETNTGHMDVPKTIAGGRCEITTNTGDIEIELCPAADGT